MASGMSREVLSMRFWQIPPRRLFLRAAGPHVPHRPAAASAEHSVGLSLYGSLSPADSWDHNYLPGMWYSCLDSNYFSDGGCCRAGKEGKMFHCSKLTWITFAVLLLVLSAGSLRAADDGWMLLDTELDHSSFYYDKGSVQRPGGDIVMLSTKVVYDNEGREEARKILKNEAYRDLAFSLYQYEINCATQQSRLARAANYNTKGGMINEFNLAGKAAWEEIPPGSRLDMVMEQECPQQ